jgi:hypothetical protein
MDTSVQWPAGRVPGGAEGGPTLLVVVHADGTRL